MPDNAIQKSDDYLRARAGITERAPKLRPVSGPAPHPPAKLRLVCWNSVRVALLLVAWLALGVVTGGVFGGLFGLWRGARGELASAPVELVLSHAPLGALIGGVTILFAAVGCGVDVLLGAGREVVRQWWAGSHPTEGAPEPGHEEGQ
jgi:hypothetical protein